MLNQKVIELLSTVNKDLDLTDELQTEIHPEIFFKRNSVNVLIGKKGSGKTYNVFREVLKLKFVENHRYTKMLYITDKPYDPTYTRMKQLMPITVQKVPYSKAVDKIRELSEAKNAIAEIKENDIKVVDLDTTRLNEVLGEEVKQDEEVFHSIVLLDDCAFLFERHTPANNALWKLLFENRQPKITYFLTMQDSKGLDTSIKEAVDTFWLFGGFTEHKFRYLMRSIPHEMDVRDIWYMYAKLTKNQALIFFNTPTGTELLVLKC